MNNNHEFIAIGDIITDLFIRLKEASLHCDIDKENCQICMPFGAKIPFEEVHLTTAAGNVGNASYSAAKLGLDSAVIGSVGDDRNGEECFETLKERGVSTDFVTVQKGKKTNYSYVLWFEDDRTILRKHEEFSYSLPEIGKPKLVYFSSISKKAYPFHNVVAEYMEKYPDVMFAFQPGSNEIKLGTEKLKRVYARTDAFFCNVEEAQEVLGLDTGTDIKVLLAKMHDLGPKIVVITDGKKGAYAYDGKDIWKQMPYPDPKPPLERTGAGDAFSSTTAIALMLGNDLPTALAWGGVNSMSVVQHVGGQDGLLSRPEIEEYLKNAPENYRAEKIN
jgi:sugar/nucleoside kinase (ribokinase family)